MGWFDGMRAAIGSRAPGSIAEHLYYAYSGLWLSVTSRYPLGTHVFEKDWDVLVVLDACRVDAMREVAPEYSFIENVESVWSVGSTSAEWYMNTFDRRHREALAETAVISSNPNAEAVLVDGDYPPRHPVPFINTGWDPASADDLAYLELTRNHDHPYNFDDPADGKTCQEPSYVTDRAIVAGRKDYERLLVHYFQPHRPLIHDYVTKGTEMSYIEDQPNRAGREGLATREEVWPYYLDNLRLVLDSIEVLLENTDAETVAITSDHAELHGELGQWGHIQSIPHPALKKVPWVETTATDTHSREPEESFREGAKRDVRQQLADLGYL